MSEGWLNKTGYALPKDAYVVAQKILHGLGRRMFDVLREAYPQAEQDAWISMAQDTTDGMLHLKDGTLSGDKAKAKFKYESTEALGIPTIHPSDTAKFTGELSDLITRLIAQAYDMQLFNVSRRPETDARAQKEKKEFEASYNALIEKIGSYPKLRGIVPIALAVKKMAEEKDISELAEKKFDLETHWVDKLPERERSIVAAVFPSNGVVQQEEHYYDRLAEDTLITANSRRR